MSSSPIAFRRWPYYVAAATALILTACSDTATTSPSKSIAPISASLDQSSNEMIDESGRHLFRTKTWYASQAPSNAGKPSWAGGSSTGISYHGGQVLQSGTNVVAVYWASSPIYSGGPTAGTSGNGSQDGSLVGFFLRNLGGSPYYNINSTYWDASNNKIVNSVTYTRFWANNSNVPANGATVSDAQMVAMLQSGFNSGALTYDDHALYAIFTADKVNLGGGFGTQYCAYHYHGTVSIGGVNKNVLYAAMPYDYAYPSGCTVGGAPSNVDAGAYYEVNTLAHETEETTTDMMGNAWYDNRGYENADKCAWTFGSTYSIPNGGTANVNLGGQDFLIQRNWVNAGSGGCTMAYP
jgi:hypothetical protein